MDDPEEQEELSQEAHRSVQDLLDLIEQILKRSKIWALRNGTDYDGAINFSAIFRPIHMSVPVNPSPIATMEPTFSSPDLSYYKVLTQIVCNIHRTLDPDTIRQETVKGLVEGLNASSCVICSYKKGSEEPVDQVPIVAAYSQGGFPSLLGETVCLADHPELKESLESCQPIGVVNKLENCFQAKSVLVVTTCYQDEPNGLIYLHQCDRHREWSETEIELYQFLKDQLQIKPQE